MGLTEEEKAQLAALQAKENEPEDNSDDEEIEIWNADGTGLRQKRRHSKAWLIDHGFAAKDPPPADNGSDNDDKGAKKSTGANRKSTARPRTSQKYFGRS